MMGMLLGSVLSRRLLVLVIGLGNRGVFTVLLSFVFPIACINRLGKGAESLQGVGLTDSSNLILDASRKTFVESPAECGRVPFDECREFIELDEVFRDTLVVAHL
jgi:hypothetical protein